MAVHRDGTYYVADVVRGQWSALERERVIRATAEMDRDQNRRVKIYLEQEPGSGGKESVEASLRNLAGFAAYGDRPTGDKDVRLEPFAAQVEAGNVALRRGTWNRAFVDELCAVPNGQYRDQADAAAGAFNKLARGGRADCGRGDSGRDAADLTHVVSAAEPGFPKPVRSCARRTEPVLRR